MNGMSLLEIVNEVNIRAESHPVGELQEFRKKIKNLKRIPSKFIFPSTLISDEWVFHRGGREEIQYNIGFEEIEGTRELRYGVAFFFFTSRYLTNNLKKVAQIKKIKNYIRDKNEKL